MATLLLALFSEEIPSRMQRGATEQLHRLITSGFDKAGLPTATSKLSCRRGTLPFKYTACRSCSPT